jgi:hypothetical protein
VPCPVGAPWGDDKEESMGRNSGRSAVPGPLVAQLVAATSARLAKAHPSVEHTVVQAVVYEAAVELASTVADPERLGRMLPLRAHARIMALTGAPIPIRSARAAHGP